jgi:hypothetical protein
MTTAHYLTSNQRPLGLYNIRLTWEAELARILPNGAYSRSDSKMRDKPLTQVEAIVRLDKY